MAAGNKKISDLVAVGAVTASDLFEVEQTATSKKATAAQIGSFLILDEDDLVSDSASKAASQQSIRVFTGFVNWQNNLIENSGGGTPLSSNYDRDIFSQFESGGAAGDIVIAFVRIISIAVEDGGQGLGYYSAEKLWTVKKQYDGTVTIEGGEVSPYQLRTDEDADHTISEDSGNVRLTVVTPAGTNYQWTTYAQIRYSSIHYEV